MQIFTAENLFLDHYRDSEIIRDINNTEYPSNMQTADIVEENARRYKILEAEMIRIGQSILLGQYVYEDHQTETDGGIVYQLLPDSGWKRHHSSYHEWKWIQSGLSRSASFVCWGDCCTCSRYHERSSTWVQPDTLQET